MKLVFNGQTVILGSESGADFIALSTKVMTELNKIASTFNAHVHIITGTGVGPWRNRWQQPRAPARVPNHTRVPLRRTNSKAS